MVIKDNNNDTSDIITQNAKRLFEVLKDDPDYQASNSMTRDEVVMAEAMQRAKQSYRNGLALSLGTELNKFLGFMADTKDSTYIQKAWSGDREDYRKIEIKGGQAFKGRTITFFEKQGVSVEEALQFAKHITNRKGKTAWNISLEGNEAIFNEWRKNPDVEPLEKLPTGGTGGFQWPSSGGGSSKKDQSKTDKSSSVAFGDGGNGKSMVELQRESISSKIAKLGQKGVLKVVKGREDDPKKSLIQSIERFTDPAVIQDYQDKALNADSLLQGLQDLSVLKKINTLFSLSKDGIDNIDNLMQQLDEVINTEKLMRGYFSKARIEEHIKHINALNNDLKAGSTVYEGILSALDGRLAGTLRHEEAYESVQNLRTRFAGGIKDYINADITMPVDENNIPNWRATYQTVDLDNADAVLNRYGPEGEMYEFTNQVSRRDMGQIYTQVYLEMYGKNHVPKTGDGSAGLLKKIENTGYRNWWKDVYDQNSAVIPEDMFANLVNMPQDVQNNVWNDYLNDPSRYSTKQSFGQLLNNHKENFHSKSTAGRSTNWHQTSSNEASQHNNSARRQIIKDATDLLWEVDGTAEIILSGPMAQAHNNIDIGDTTAPYTFAIRSKIEAPASSMPYDHVRTVLHPESYTKKMRATAKKQLNEINAIAAKLATQLSEVDGEARPVSDMVQIEHISSNNPHDLRTKIPEGEEQVHFFHDNMAEQLPAWGSGADAHEPFAAANTQRQALLPADLFDEGKTLKNRDDFRKNIKFIRSNQVFTKKQFQDLIESNVFYGNHLRKLEEGMDETPLDLTLMGARDRVDTANRLLSDLYETGLPDENDLNTAFGDGEASILRDMEHRIENRFWGTFNYPEAVSEYIRLRKSIKDEKVLGEDTLAIYRELQEELEPLFSMIDNEHSNAQQLLRQAENEYEQGIPQGFKKNRKGEIVNKNGDVLAPYGSGYVLEMYANIDSPSEAKTLRDALIDAAVATGEIGEEEGEDKKAEEFNIYEEPDTMPLYSDTELEKIQGERIKAKHYGKELEPYTKKVSQWDDLNERYVEANQVHREGGYNQTVRVPQREYKKILTDSIEDVEGTSILIPDARLDMIYTHTTDTGEQKQITLAHLVPRMDQEDIAKFLETGQLSFENQNPKYEFYDATPSSQGRINKDGEYEPNTSSSFMRGGVDQRYIGVDDDTDVEVSLADPWQTSDEESEDEIPVDNPQAANEEIQRLLDSTNTTKDAFEVTVKDKAEGILAEDESLDFEEAEERATLIAMNELSKEAEDLEPGEELYDIGSESLEEQSRHDTQSEMNYSTRMRTQQEQAKAYKQGFTIPKPLLDAIMNGDWNVMVWGSGGEGVADAFMERITNMYSRLSEGPRDNLKQTRLSELQQLHPIIRQDFIKQVVQWWGLKHADKDDPEYIKLGLNADADSLEGYGIIPMIGSLFDRSTTKAEFGEVIINRLMRDALKASENPTEYIQGSLSLLGLPVEQVPEYTKEFEGFLKLQREVLNKEKPWEVSLLQPMADALMAYVENPFETDIQKLMPKDAEGLPLFDQEDIETLRTTLNQKYGQYFNTFIGQGVDEFGESEAIPDQIPENAQEWNGWTSDSPALTLAMEFQSAVNSLEDGADLTTFIPPTADMAEFWANIQTNLVPLSDSAKVSNEQRAKLDLPDSYWTGYASKNKASYYRMYDQYKAIADDLYPDYEGDTPVRNMLMNQGYLSPGADGSYDKQLHHTTEKLTGWDLGDGWVFKALNRWTDDKDTNVFYLENDKLYKAQAKASGGGIRKRTAEEVASWNVFKNIFADDNEIKEKYADTWEELQNLPENEALTPEQLKNVINISKSILTDGNKSSIKGMEMSVGGTTMKVFGSRRAVGAKAGALANLLNTLHTADMGRSSVTARKKAIDAEIANVDSQTPRTWEQYKDDMKYQIYQTSPSGTEQTRAFEFDAREMKIRKTLDNEATFNDIISGMDTPLEDLIQKYGSLENVKNILTQNEMLHWSNDILFENLKTHTSGAAAPYNEFRNASNWISLVEERAAERKSWLERDLAQLEEDFLKEEISENDFSRRQKNLNDQIENLKYGNIYSTGGDPGRFTNIIVFDSVDKNGIFRRKPLDHEKHLQMDKNLPRVPIQDDVIIHMPRVAYAKVFGSDDWYATDNLGLLQAYFKADVNEEGDQVFHYYLPSDGDFEVDEYGYLTGEFDIRTDANTGELLKPITEEKPFSENRLKRIISGDTILEKSRTGEVKALDVDAGRIETEPAVIQVKLDPNAYRDGTGVSWEWAKIFSNSGLDVEKALEFYNTLPEGPRYKTLKRYVEFKEWEAKLKQDSENVISGDASGEDTNSRWVFSQQELDFRGMKKSLEDNYSWLHDYIFDSDGSTLKEENLQKLDAFLVGNDMGGFLGEGTKPELRKGFISTVRGLQNLALHFEGKEDSPEGHDGKFNNMISFFKEEGVRLPDSIGQNPNEYTPSDSPPVQTPPVMEGEGGRPWNLSQGLVRKLNDKFPGVWYEGAYTKRGEYADGSEWISGNHPSRILLDTDGNFQRDTVLGLMDNPHITDEQREEILTFLEQNIVPYVQENLMTLAGTPINEGGRYSPDQQLNMVRTEDLTALLKATPYEPQQDYTSVMPTYPEGLYAMPAVVEEEPTAAVEEETEEEVSDSLGTMLTAILEDSTLSDEQKTAMIAELDALKAKASGSDDMPEVDPNIGQTDPEGLTRQQIDAQTKLTGGIDPRLDKLMARRFNTKEWQYLLNGLDVKGEDPWDASKKEAAVTLYEHYSTNEADLTTAYKSLVIDAINNDIDANKETAPKLSADDKIERWNEWRKAELAILSARNRLLDRTELNNLLPENLREGYEDDVPANFSDEELISNRDAAVKNNEKLTNDRLEQIEQMKAGDANNHFTNAVQALLANPSQDQAEVLARDLMRHKREYDTDDPIKRRANQQQYMTTGDKERLYSNDDSLWNVLINATDQQGRPLVDVEALIAEENEIKEKHAEAGDDKARLIYEEFNDNLTAKINDNEQKEERAAKANQFINDNKFDQFYHPDNLANVVINGTTGKVTRLGAGGRVEATFDSYEDMLNSLEDKTAAPHIMGLDEEQRAAVQLLQELRIQQAKAPDDESLLEAERELEEHFKADPHLQSVWENMEILDPAYQERMGIGINVNPKTGLPVDENGMDVLPPRVYNPDTKREEYAVLMNGMWVNPAIINKIMDQAETSGGDVLLLNPEILNLTAELHDVDDIDSELLRAIIPIDGQAGPILVTQGGQIYKLPSTQDEIDWDKGYSREELTGIVYAHKLRNMLNQDLESEQAIFVESPDENGTINMRPWDEWNASAVGQQANEEKLGRTIIPGYDAIAGGVEGASAKFLSYIRSVGSVISEERGQPEEVSKNTTLRQQLFETNFLGFRKIIDWKNWFSQDESYLDRQVYNMMQTQRAKEREKTQHAARILHETDPKTYNEDGSRKVDLEGEAIPTAQQLEAEQLAERTRRNKMRDRMQELTAGGMSEEDASKQVVQEFTPQEEVSTPQPITVTTDETPFDSRLPEPEVQSEIIDPDALPDSPIVASNEAKTPDVTKSALGNLVDYVGYNR